MRTVTITLPDEVYSFLELRAAIDDMRIKEGIERLLDEAIHRFKGGEPRNINSRFKD